MERISLSLAGQSHTYQILIGEGLISKAGALMREADLTGRLLVVTNPTVARWYLQPLMNSLAKAGYEAQAVLVEDGERYKSMEEANRLYNELIAGRFDRKAALVALGGGVIGDLAGFVAATYLRGIRYVQVPTTLLAQVDSSVGGKVAVNHQLGKNLIGAFHQPRLVIADVASLRTLPPPEFGSGMAEVVKHGLILDENYYQLVRGEFTNIRRADPGIMTWVVAGSCKIKGDIVMSDEKESGIRTILNFGHTVGHALESVTNYSRFKHGEAVALGMLAAAGIAAAADVLKEEGFAANLAECLRELDLPVEIPGLGVEAILRALELDKKMDSGKIRWVLPKRLGEVVVNNRISLETVRRVLREMGAVEGE